MITINTRLGEAKNILYMYVQKGGYSHHLITDNYTKTKLIYWLLASEADCSQQLLSEVDAEVMHAHFLS